MRNVVERITGLADLLINRVAPPWFTIDHDACGPPAGAEPLPPPAPAGSPQHDVQIVLAVALRRAGCAWPQTLARIGAHDLAQHFTWTRK